MARKVILSCAVTGSARTPQIHSRVPVTPAEIAESALEAARAGASIVHIHVRDPQTSLPSTKLALYQDVVGRIRDSEVDVIINLTTGPGARFFHGEEDPKLAAPGSTLCLPQQRIDHVLKLRPEICSLDVATMNRDGFTLINLPNHLRSMLQVFGDAGVKPEIEVFDGGHLELARELIQDTNAGQPCFIQFCLGVKWGMPATESAIKYLASRVPAGALWSAFGVGKFSQSVVEHSVASGGHVRVGFEDNLYLRKGVLADSNAALVEQAVHTIEQEGASVATVSEARSLLGLFQ
ncbi:MAG: 3-keto-5-aminohexanoate cleavage protein [Halioglobus sp.]